MEMRPKLDPLVDFVIIGAMKAGTTDLAAKLAHHSEVCFCSRKEPHFFNAREDWRNGLADYHRLFAPESGQICGEASTSYSDLATYPNVVRRLWDYNPGLKLIYLVRDPVDRIRSHYAHELMRGLADTEPRKEFAKRMKKYISCSSYGSTLAKYAELFDMSQILVIDFSSYTRAMNVVTERITDFLGLTHEDLSQIVAPNRSAGSNRSPLSPIYYTDYLLAFSPMFLRKRIGRKVSVKLRKKPVLPSDLETELRHELRSDIDLFATLTGMDVESWRRAD